LVLSQKFIVDNINYKVKFMILNYLRIIEKKIIVDNINYKV